MVINFKRKIQPFTFSRYSIYDGAQLNPCGGGVTTLTDRKEVIELIEREYLPKILGFAYKNTNRREDAEDLAQDIALQLLTAVNAGKRADNWNAFVWSVSGRTLCKWLRKKKRGETVYLSDTLPDLGERVGDALTRREEKSLLLREIGMLSQKYREAVVLHYFDGRTCEEIAQTLGRSAGTVKWWLHGARKYIEEGMDTVREYGMRSVKPGTLKMSCQYAPGADYEPMSCAMRKSAQNILLAAYQNPMTAAELSAELGISAPYIEDEVEYLAYNQLMAKTPGEKYQTDFVILPGDDPTTATEIYKSCFPGYSDALLAFAEKHMETLCSGRFNRAGFSWERLLWVYLHLFTEACLDKFRCGSCKTVTYNDVPDRPNGGKWIALGFENMFYSER